MTLTYDPVELTQRLIQIPSVSPDKGEALDVIEAHLSGLGFTCHRKVFSGGGSYPVDNLYARYGTAQPNLCFAGHTDVVPPGDEELWQFPPFQAHVEKGVLYGRGAADMKGAIAAFICAVQESLQTSPPKGSISFLITGDEEADAINGTKQALEWIYSKEEILDACIVGEASCAEVLGDTLKVGRRDSLSGTLIVKGQQGHIAYPHLAQNPIPVLTSIVNSLYAKDLDKGDKNFEPSNFEVTTIDCDNPATNVIPGQIQADFNIRYSPQQTCESLQKWVEKTIRTYTKDYDLVWKEGSQPFYTEEGGLRQVMTQAVQSVTGLMPECSTGGGTSDGRFIHKYCPVVEFGVTNKTIHKVDECVPTADLLQLKDVYKKAIELFF